jgi:hypothetical protein
MKESLERVPWRSLAAGAFAFAFTLLVAHGRSTPYNNYVLLAQSFLSGHVWVSVPPNDPGIDALTYGLHAFIIEAPFPAVLLMPLVAAFGSNANQTLLAVLLAGVAIGATWELGQRLGLDWVKNVWLCAFALAGTDLLWCAMLGDVWFIAHVAAHAFTMLALVELFGKRRGWLVMLWAACAFESRFGMVIALPVYAYLLLSDAQYPLRLDPAWQRRLVGMAAVLVPVGVLWLWYNQARWGTWADIGYTAWYHQDQIGSPTGSPFALANVPMELAYFFLQLPARVKGFPWIVPTMVGQALTFTSPALILAFFVRPFLSRTTLALWAAVILCATPNVVYYANGAAQFGMRHALDFEPFLIALIALAIRERLPIWGRILIAYSVVVGMWGCWFWNSQYRPFT